MINKLNDIIDFCKNINGSQGYNDTKKQLIDEMVNDYDYAHKNMITRFQVVKDTVDGKDVSINFSEKTYRGVVGTKKKEGAKSIAEKSMQLEPNLMHKGDYLTFKMNTDDELHTYIVTSNIERCNGYDEGIFLICNQVITLIGCPLQYCNADDSSYGQKGVIDSTLMTYTDGQVKLLTQDNEYTKAIPLGYRLIFDHDNKSIFEVVKNDTVTTKDVRRIMIKKTDLDSRDDLENNIAYNEKKLELNGCVNPDIPIIETKYKIVDTKKYLHNEYCPDGYDGKMRYNYTTKIFVEDENGNDLSDVVFDIESNIDELNSKYKTIKIISQGNNFIEIKNVAGGSDKDLNIIFKKDNIELPIKIKLDR